MRATAPSSAWPPGVRASFSAYPSRPARRAFPNVTPAPVAGVFAGAAGRGAVPGVAPATDPGVDLAPAEERRDRRSDLGVFSEALAGNAFSEWNAFSESASMHPGDFMALSGLATTEGDALHAGE